MPNRRVHIISGTAAGLTWAALTPPVLEGKDLAWTLTGGAIGGAIGGALPDLLEPADSPCHRSLGHSWLVLAAIVQLNSGEWARYFHAVAEQCLALASNPWLTLEVQQAYRRQANLNRMIAGVLAGLPAGYVSHLALDACTPSGLPVLARKVG
jgi:membrane-bound metal-dependent hydrolase YbcI (DUF457 family)